MLGAPCFAICASARGWLFSDDFKARLPISVGKARQRDIQRQQPAELGAPSLALEVIGAAIGSRTLSALLGRQASHLELNRAVGASCAGEPLTDN